MAACLYCAVAPADLGRYCSGCYVQELHDDGEPLVLDDPRDPWRDFNAEGNRYIADCKAHAVLWPRIEARRSFLVKADAWKAAIHSPGAPKQLRSQAEAMRNSVAARIWADLVRRELPPAQFKAQYLEAMEAHPIHSYMLKLAMSDSPACKEFNHEQ